MCIYILCMCIYIMYIYSHHILVCIFSWRSIISIDSRFGYPCEDLKQPLHGICPGSSLRLPGPSDLHQFPALHTSVPSSSSLLLGPFIKHLLLSYNIEIQHRKRRRELTFAECFFYHQVFWVLVRSTLPL